MRIFSCLLFFVLWLALDASSQRFGGNPPSQHWQQVQVPAVRVIFPLGMDSAARRIAGVEQFLSIQTLPTLGNRSLPVDIVLQTLPLISNGYVSLGPFRSEFYLTPPQNSFALGSLPWQDLLSFHEFRHVQQYNNFNVGLSHAFRLVFGQAGQELANSLAIPNWFWEGDAVFQETMVSNQGRGRIPYFFNDYRSLWKAGDHYSYMKLRNGSLRDFTPDHYRLGYMMVAYGREKYGEQFWKSITHESASFKGFFFPFQKALRAASGKSLEEFSREARDFFRQQDSLAFPAQPAHQGHFLADQEYPAYQPDGSLLYLRSSYRQLPAFVLRQNGRERTLRVRDLAIDNHFSAREGKIVYASLRPDIRWSWKEYNELKLLDTRTGRERTLTRATRYFSPDLSPDGQTIVAVEVQPGGASQLHLLAASDGRLLKILPNPNHYFFTYPRFYKDGKILATVRNTAAQMALVLVDTLGGEMGFLTPFSSRILGFPSVKGDSVFFTASARRQDRVYCLVAARGPLLELENASTGIGMYEPVMGGQGLCYTSFTDQGFRLEEIKRADLQWRPLDLSGWQQPAPDFGIHFGPLSGKGMAVAAQKDSFPARPYPKSFHLFNFHSVLPYIQDPDYSLYLEGENVLNTLQSELLLRYNRDEGYRQLGANATYAAWFPQVSAGINYLMGRNALYRAGSKAYWNETQLNASFGIPLHLSRGRQLTGLNFGSGYVYNRVAFTGTYKDSLRNFAFGYLNHFLSFTRQTQQVQQQIYPHWAQTLLVTYRQAIQKVEANQLLVSGSLYFPGLSPTHSLVVNAAYQHRDTLNQYIFSNSFPFSRGYTSPNLRQLVKWGVNYHFPLLYPDAGLANMIYLLRVRANLFYDHSTGTVAYINGPRLATDFRSYGTEIFFDTKWWNQLPISFGLRYSHLMDPDLFGGRGPNWFEFILPVNLFQK